MGAYERERAGIFVYLYDMASKVIEFRFDIGELVYLKTDVAQSPRIVFCYKVYKGEILYDLACGTVTSSHYEFEISTEINVILTTTN